MSKELHVRKSVEHLTAARVRGWGEGGAREDWEGREGHNREKELNRCVFAWCIHLNTEAGEGSNAVCCSVLQRVAVCCSSLQCTVCYSVLQRVAACCSVLQCVAVCCRGATGRMFQFVTESCSVKQCDAVCCSVMQCTKSHVNLPTLISPPPPPSLNKGPLAPLEPLQHKCVVHLHSRASVFHLRLRCVYPYIYIYPYKCVYVFVYVVQHIYIHTYVHMCKCAYIQINTRVYIHIYWTILRLTSRELRTPREREQGKERERERERERCLSTSLPTSNLDIYEVFAYTSHCTALQHTAIQCNIL